MSVDALQRDHGDRRSQRPLAVLDDVRAVVDDLQARLEDHPVEVQPARRSGRRGRRGGCRRARSGRYRRGPSRTGSRTARPRETPKANSPIDCRRSRRPSITSRRRLGLLAALDLDRLAVLDRPGDRLGPPGPGGRSRASPRRRRSCPSVRSSTAANATSAQSGSGPIIWPRRLIEVTSSAGRPSIVTVTSVPLGEVTCAPSVAPSSAAIASLRALGRGVDLLDRQAPLAHPRLDRAILALFCARLLDRRHVREAVRPLEVRDDDDLVRVRHRLVQVARRHHREVRVGAARAEPGPRCP